MTNEPVNPWEGYTLIHAYSRAQALEDGVLVDVSELAREAGFLYPVAVTQALYSILDPSPDLQRAGQSFTGRAWDMLSVLRATIRATRAPGDEVRFAPLFIREPEGSPEPLVLRSVCAPGDAGEPTITVMLGGED
jgi:hypothetical protein